MGPTHSCHPCGMPKGPRGLSGSAVMSLGAGGPCSPRAEEAARSSLSIALAFSLVSLSRSLWYSFTHCCSVSSGLWPCVAPT